MARREAKHFKQSEQAAEQVTQAAAPAGGQPAAAAGGGEPPKRKRSVRTWLAMLLALVLVVAMGGAIAYAAIGDGGDTGGGGTESGPNTDGDTGGGGTESGPNTDGNSGGDTQGGTDSEYTADHLYHIDVTVDGTFEYTYEITEEEDGVSDEPITSVTKVWEDGEENHANDSVTVYLVDADGDYITETVTDDDGNTTTQYVTITLSADNDWTCVINYAGSTIEQIAARLTSGADSSDSTTENEGTTDDDSYSVTVSSYVYAVVETQINDDTVEESGYTVTDYDYGYSEATTEYGSVSVTSINYVVYEAAVDSSSSESEAILKYGYYFYVDSDGNEVTATTSASYTSGNTSVSGTITDGVFTASDGTTYDVSYDGTNYTITVNDTTYTLTLGSTTYTDSDGNTVSLSTSYYFIDTDGTVYLVTENNGAYTFTKDNTTYTLTASTVYTYEDSGGTTYTGTISSSTSGNETTYTFSYTDSDGNTGSKTVSPTSGTDSNNGSYTYYTYEDSDGTTYTLAADTTYSYTVSSETVSGLDLKYGYYYTTSDGTVVAVTKYAAVSGTYYGQSSDKSNTNREEYFMGYYENDEAVQNNEGIYVIESFRRLTDFTTSSTFWVNLTYQIKDSSGNVLYTVTTTVEYDASSYNDCSGGNASTEKGFDAEISATASIYPSYIYNAPTADLEVTKTVAATYTDSDGDTVYAPYDSDDEFYFEITTLRNPSNSYYSLTESTDSTTGTTTYTSGDYTVTSSNGGYTLTIAGDDSSSSTTYALTGSDGTYTCDVTDDDGNVVTRYTFVIESETTTSTDDEGNETTETTYTYTLTVTTWPTTSGTDEDGNDIAITYSAYVTDADGNWVDNESIGSSSSTDEDGNVTYTYGTVSEGMTVTLGAGETLHIVGLVDGAVYEITELGLAVSTDAESSDDSDDEESTGLLEAAASAVTEFFSDVADAVASALGIADDDATEEETTETTYTMGDYTLVERYLDDDEYTTGDDSISGSIVVETTTTKDEDDNSTTTTTTSNNSLEFVNATDSKTVADEDGNDVDGDDLEVGDTLTYTVLWVNNATTTTTETDEEGNETTTTTAADAEVTITDIVPAGTEYTSAAPVSIVVDGVTYTATPGSDGTYTFSDGSTTLTYGDSKTTVTATVATSTDDDGNTVVTWTITNAPADSYGSVELVVTVTSEAVTENAINNTATIKVGDDSYTTNTTTNTVSGKTVTTTETTEITDEDGTTTTESTTEDAAGDLVEVGDELTYVVSWTNDTEDAATVTITDDIPAGTEYKSASYLTIIYEGVTYTATEKTGTDSEGNSYTYYIFVNGTDTLTYTDSSGDTQTVTATLTLTYATETDEDGNTVTTSTVTSVKWEITKAPAGSHGTVQLVVTVTDDALDNANNLVTNSATVTIDNVSNTYTVTNSVPEKDVFATTATTESDESDDDESSNDTTDDSTSDDESSNDTTDDDSSDDSDDSDDDADTTVTYTATGDSIDGQTVGVGDVLEYRIYFTNSTDDTATVYVYDKVPEGTTFVEDSQYPTADTTTMTFTYIDEETGETKTAEVTVTVSFELTEGTTLTWTITGVPAGYSGYVSYQVLVSEGLAGETFENTAGVSLNNDADYTLTNTVENNAPKKEGENLTDPDDEALNMGDILEYEITFTYDGVGDGTGTGEVTVEDKLAQGLMFYGTSTDGETYAGSSVVIVASTSEDEYGNETTTYTYYVIEYDETTEAYVVYEATAKTTKDADGNETTTYTKGDAVSSTDAPLTFSVNEYADADPSQTLTWVLSGLTEGDEVTIIFDVMVSIDTLTSVTNQATVGGHSTNIVTLPTDDESSKTVTDSDGVNIDGQTVSVGDEITYTILWVADENVADADYTVTIVDHLPLGVTVKTPTEENVTNSGQVSDDGDGTQTVTWEIGNVVAGEKGEVSVTVVVTGDVTTLVNSAYVNDVETNSVTNYVPDKEQTNSDLNSKDALEVGDVLDYTLEFVVTEDLFESESTDDETDEQSEGETTETSSTVTVVDSLAQGLQYLTSADSTTEVTYYDEYAILAVTTTTVTETTTATPNGTDSDGNTTYTYSTETSTTTETVYYWFESSTSTTTDEDGEEVTTTTYTVYTATATTDEDGNITGYTKGDAVTTMSYTFGVSGDASDGGQTLTWEFTGLPTTSETTKTTESTSETTGVITTTVTTTTVLPTMTIYFQAMVTSDSLAEVDNSFTVGGKKSDKTETPTDTESYKSVSADTDADGTTDIEDADGDLVGVGTLLTYTIDWANAAINSETGDYVAASVIVTDVIPTGSELYYTTTNNDGVPQYVVDGISSNGWSIARDDDDNTITETINGVTYSVYEASLTDGGKVYYYTGSRTLVWELGTQAAGAKGTVSFTVVVTEDAVENTSITYYVWDEDKGEWVETTETVDNTLVNQAMVSFSSSDYTLENTYTYTNEVTNEVPEKDVVSGDSDGDGDYTDETSIDTDDVAVGDVLTYVITFTNTEDEPATVTVTDSIPAGTTYVEGSGKLSTTIVTQTTNDDGTVTYTIASANTTATYSNGTLTWTMANVAPGVDVTITFQVTVTEDALTLSSIDNTASVKIGNNSAVSTNTTTNQTEDKTVWADQDGDDSTVDTIVDGDLVSVGDTLTYTVRWENTSDGSAVVTVKDTIPSGTEYVTDSAAFSSVVIDGVAYHINVADDGTITASYTDSDDVTTTYTLTLAYTTDDDNVTAITWTIGTSETGVPAGSYGVVTFKVTVTDDAATQTDDVTNQATVYVGNDSYQTNVTENDVPEKDVVEVTTTTEEDGSTSTSTTEANDVQVGDVLQYSITVVSPEEVSQITITDSAPEGTEYVTGSQTYSVVDSEGNALTGETGTVTVSFSYDEDEGTLTWTIAATEGNTIPEDAVIIVTFNVTVTEDALDNTDDEIVNDASVTIGEGGYTVTTNKVTTELETDDLTISKTVSSSDDDTVFAFTIVLKDSAGNALTGEYGFTGTVSEASTSTDEDGNEVTTYTAKKYTSENAGTIDFDENGTATVYLTGGQSITITGLPEGATYTVTEATNASYTTTVSVNGGEASATHVASGTIGADTVQTVAYTNTSADQSKDVYASDDTDYSDSIDGDLVGVGDVLTYVINWTNTATDSSGAATSATVNITDKVPAGTEYVADSAAPISLVVDGVTYTATESSTTSGSYTFVDESGNTLTYDVEGTATNVTATVSTSTNEDGDTVVTWTIENAPANATGSVSFQVKVTSDAVDLVDDASTEDIDEENNVTNTATVKIGNDYSVDTNTTENPVPEKTETSDAEKVYEGEQLEYEISFTNTEGDADNTATATVTDTLVKGLTYVTEGDAADSYTVTVNGETTSNVTFSFSNSTLTWVITGLVDGDEVVVTFTVTVTSEAGDVVTNTAQVDGHSTNTVTTPSPKKTVTNTDSEDIDGDTVGVGDTLTYTVTYVNTETEAATVTITDEIPENTQYVTGSAADTSNTSLSYKLYDADDEELEDSEENASSVAKIVWTVSDVAAGTMGSVSFQVTVLESAAGETINNTATVQVGNNSSQQTNTTTNNVPEKTVTDADGNEAATAVIGSTLTFSIEFVADGETVEVVDELEAGLEYVKTTSITVNGTAVDSDNDEPSVYGQTLTWSFGGNDSSLEALTVGDKVVITFTVTVTSAVTDGTIENSATVGGHKSNTTTTELTGKTVYSDDVSVDGELVGVGDVLTYTIYWVNDAVDEDGNATSATVKITDIIPEGTEYVEDSASDNGTYSDGTITWSIDAAAGESGSVSFQVKVLSDATDNDDNAVTNRPKVLVNDSEQETNTTTTYVPEKTENTDPDAITEGDVLEYSITFKNTEGADATATVVDTLDSGLDYTETVSVTSTVDGETTTLVSDTDYTVSTDGQTVTWTISGLAEGATVVVTFTVTVTSEAGDVVTNTAQVDGHSTNIVTTPAPKKSVSVADSDGTTIGGDGDTVGVGDVLTYTITYANGEDTASDVIITDSIPEGSVYVEGSATTGDGITVTYTTDDDGNVTGITWVISSVASGSTGSVSFQVTVTEDAVTGDPVNNTASVQVGDNPSVNTNTTENPTPVKTVMDAEGNDVDGGSVQVGDVLTFSITFTADAESVTVVDKLDEGLSFKETVSVTYGDDGTVTTGLLSAASAYVLGTSNYSVSTDGQTTTWELSNLTVGETYTITFTATVTATSAGEIENTATVGGHSTNTNTVEVETGDLTIKKTVEGTTATDKEFTFTITLDPAVSETFNTSDGGSVTFTEGVATVILTAGESITITGLPAGAEYTVEETEIPDGYSLTTGADDMTGTITKDATVTVTAVNTYSATGSDTIQITKTVGSGYILSGGDFTFVLKDSSGNTIQTVTNLEDGTAYFDALTFSAAGEYVYTITEVHTTAAGVSFDGTVYTITYTVTDNGDGTLKVSKVITSTGTTGSVESITFYNPYDPESITVSINGTKSISDTTDSGRTAQTGEFTFRLVEVSDATGTTEVGEAVTVTNTGLGFEFKDVATFTQPGTKYFKVTEVAGSDASMSYDTTTYIVKVVVTGTDALSSEITYYTLASDGTLTEVSDGIAFTNTYEPGEPAKDVVDADGESIDGDTVGVGDTLTYVVSWENDAVDSETGANVAATVVITDEIPEGTVYVSGSASSGAKLYDADGNELDDTEDNAASVAKIVWTIEAAANETGTVSFQVTVDEDAVENDDNAITNTATIKVGNNSSQKTNTTTNYVPEKTVTDAEGNEAAEALVGDVLTYTISYANTGDEAVDITITDSIPTGTVYVANSATTSDDISVALTYADDGETVTAVTWSISGVAANTSGTVSFQVTVTEDAIDTSIENQATVKIGDNEYSTNKVTTEVNPAGLTISKTVEGTLANTSKVFEFTIELADASSNALSGTYSFTGTVSEATEAEDGTVSYETKTYSEGSEGTITFTNGIATVYLAGGQSITITGLPEGATYTVTETAVSGYTASVTSNTGTNAESSGNVASGTLTTDSDDEDAEPSATVAFTNTYGVEPVSSDTSALLTKVLEGRSWTDDDVFTFTITAVDGAPLTDDEGNSVASKTVTVTAEDLKNGVATFGFGTLTFTSEDMEDAELDEETGYYTKTFTYTVSEVEGDAAGITYSSNVATITVTVYDDGAGNLVAKATTGENTTFTNTYTSELEYATAGGVYITKTIEGTSMEAGEFKFTIVCDDTDSTTAAELAEKLFGDSSATTKVFSNTAAADGGTSTINVLAGDHEVTFTQDDAGKTYQFTVSETTGGGSGYTNDTTVYTVIISIEDDGEGTLTAYTTVESADGSYSKTYVYSTGDDLSETGVYAVIPFENSYEAEGDVTIEGTKTLESKTGRTLEEGEFTFELLYASEADSANATVIATTTNDADGDFAFTLSYTSESLEALVEAGLATINSDGQYVIQYVVLEATDSLSSGVSAGTYGYAVTVTVTDQGDGTYSCAVTYPSGSNSVDFTNYYQTDEIAITVNGIKVLELEDESLTTTIADIAGLFTFTITADSDDAPMPESTTATNDAAGNVSFGTITFTDECLNGESSRTFTYTVTESGSVAGVTNDATTSYSFTVTVTDLGTGELDGETVNYIGVTVESDGELLFSFTNTYGVEPVEASITDTLDVDKALEGRDLEAGEFEFVLVETSTDADGEPVATVAATGTNAADGTVTMSSITYTTPGEHDYTLYELNSGAGGVDYSAVVYWVHVSVTDAGDGTLAVSTTFVEGDYETYDAVTFYNTYEPASTTVILGAAKVLEGADLTEGAFTFQLLDADGNVLVEATNDANGSVAFEALEFSAVGEYTYTIVEVADDVDGMTYDTSAHTVLITVTDGGEGQLVASVSYDEADATAPVFVNAYEEEEPEPEEPEEEESEPEEPEEEEEEAEPEEPEETEEEEPEEEEEEAEPTLPGEETPQTGDSATPWVAAILCIVAVGCIATGLVLRRRKR